MPLYYTCKICDFGTKNKYDMNRHLNKKNKCVPSSLNKNILTDEENKVEALIPVNIQNNILNNNILNDKSIVSSNYSSNVNSSVNSSIDLNIDSNPDLKMDSNTNSNTELITNEIPKESIIIDTNIEKECRKCKNNIKFSKHINVNVKKCCYFIQNKDKIYITYLE